MKNTALYFLGLCLIISAGSCKPEGDKDDITSSDAPKSFTNVLFSKTNAFFSTTGSALQPMDTNAAKLSISTIDITYIFDSDYNQPGFFDPVTRSQEWYWDNYYLPWLSTAREVRYYYSSTVDATDYNAALEDESLIAGFLDEMTIAPHGIFTEGSCIGGRQTSDPVSYLLAEGSVYGFKITSTGKKGLIHVRPDQETAWPHWNSETKVDILVEN